MLKTRLLLASIPLLALLGIAVCRYADSAGTPQELPDVRPAAVVNSSSAVDGFGSVLILTKDRVAITLHQAPQGVSALLIRNQVYPASGIYSPRRDSGTAVEDLTPTEDVLILSVDLGAESTKGSRFREQATVPVGTSVFLLGYPSDAGDLPELLSGRSPRLIRGVVVASRDPDTHDAMTIEVTEKGPMKGFSGGAAFVVEEGKAIVIGLITEFRKETRFSGAAITSERRFLIAAPLPHLP